MCSAGGPPGQVWEALLYTIQCCTLWMFIAVESQALWYKVAFLLIAI